MKLAKLIMIDLTQKHKAQLSSTKLLCSSYLDWLLSFGTWSIAGLTTNVLVKGGLLLAPGLLNIRQNTQPASQPPCLTHFYEENIQIKKQRPRKFQLEDSLVAASCSVVWHCPAPTGGLVLSCGPISYNWGLCGPSRHLT